jgi:uncharacterized protein YjiS (DUF1127 family)
MSTHEESASAFHPYRLGAQVPFLELVAPVQFVGAAVMGAIALAGRAVCRSKTRIAHLANVRRTTAELEALDDLLLRDIGVSRAEIRAIAKRAVDGHYAHKGAWPV